MIPKSPGFRLDGRRAVVTGAGRGIGLAAAAALAEAGAAVTPTGVKATIPLTMTWDDLRTLRRPLRTGRQRRLNSSRPIRRPAGSVRASLEGRILGLRQVLEEYRELVAAERRTIRFPTVTV